MKVCLSRDCQTLTRREAATDSCILPTLMKSPKILPLWMRRTTHRERSEL